MKPMTEGHLAVLRRHMAAAASAKGRAGAGRAKGGPGSGPATASSRRALSRTLRVSACPAAKPCQPSPSKGPLGVLPCVGFSL